MVFGWDTGVVPLERSQPCAVVVKCQEDFEHFSAHIDDVVYSFAESTDSAKQVDARGYVRRHFLYAERVVLQGVLDIRWG